MLPIVHDLPINKCLGRPDPECLRIPTRQRKQPQKLSSEGSNPSVGTDFVVKSGLTQASAKR